MDIYKISKAMKYEEPKKNIRVGDYVKQRHWPDAPSNWCRVLRIEDNGKILRLEHQPGGNLPYSMDMDWVVKKVKPEATITNIRVGDLVRQAHWSDRPANWCRVVSIEADWQRLRLEHPPVGDHPGGIVTYSLNEDWIVKRILKEKNSIAYAKKAKERKQKPKLAPMPAQALRRFPSHPSDILILLSNI